MKDLLKGAVLVAVTAFVVTLRQGDAQQPTPVNFGDTFWIVCTDGAIDNANIFEGYLGTWDISWRTLAGLTPDLSSNGILLANCTASLGPGESLGP